MTGSLKNAPCASCGGGASCQCGGTGCSRNVGECRGGPLQRPVFFSGQLLTEEDLQLLSDYTATKSRLHNRFLHGDGVVCGLLVMCNPCGGGRVVVQPGTALDCCGNQILVPCPVELDINAMVQALRIEKRGGYDCGDPCKDAKSDCDNGKNPAPKPAPASGQAGVIPGRGPNQTQTPDFTDRVERRGRRYCLYLKYCEITEEPVAPYVSNGDCAVQVCKPTRIREGYTFELRCVEKDEPEDNVFRRILCCIGDLTRADKAASDAASADIYYSRAHAALPYVSAGKVPDFGEADVNVLNANTQKLAKLQTSMQASKSARNEFQKELSETSVREYLDAYQTVASAVIRYDLQPQQKSPSVASGEEAAKLIVAARQQIKDLGDPLLKAAVAKLPASRDRLVAETWISQGMHWTDPNLAPEDRKSEARLLYAYNAPYSKQLQKQYRGDLRDFRDWLLDRLEHKPLFSDCRLRHDVLAIDLPGDTLSKRDFPAIQKLVIAFLRYLIDCICAALNPPCPPCEDEAVKLACLTVDECEVISICNLERKFVLSGPALRYWVPFLHAIGELFERACCTPLSCLIDLDGEKDEKQTYLQSSGKIELQQAYMKKSAPAYRHIEGEPELTTLFQLARIDEKTLESAVNLGGNLGTVTGIADLLSSSFVRSAGSRIGTRVGGAAAEKLFDQPRFREAMDERIAVEMAEVRRRAEESLKSGAMEERFKEAISKIDQSATEAKNASTRTARELKSALQEQEKLNAALERKLDALEKKVKP